MEQNMQKVVMELLSGTFFIPQHCACCAGQEKLSDRKLEHSSSSSSTNGNVVTTTTTTNSITVKLCDACRESVEKEVGKANGIRTLLYLLVAAVCSVFIFGKARDGTGPIGLLAAVALGGFGGGWILFAATFGWMLPNEERVWRKRLGGLGRATFDFTKPGEQESSLKNVLIPYFASSAYDALFDAANPSLLFMKSISKVSIKR